MRVTSKILGAKVSIEEVRLIQSENPEVIIEKDSQGSLILEGMTDYYIGTLLSDLMFQLEIWYQTHQSGRVMGVATSYYLPNGALRSPDISWISEARLAASGKGKGLVPDFVIELRSPTDKVGDLIRKMQEYQSCEVRLGWIVDPIDECCYLFRSDGKPETVYGFDRELSGEEVLINFSLNLHRLQRLR